MSRDRFSATLLRLDYFAHRWVGTVTGVMIFVWFASGIAMQFYPWPLLTESQTLATLRPFQPDSTLIGFSRAAAAAAASLPDGQRASVLASGRLQLLGNRPVYQFRRDHGREQLPAVLVDGRSGAVLSPITPALAEAAARSIAGTERRVVGIDLLQRGDRYMMNGDYAAQFPAYRIRFGDAPQTAVYVNSRGGNPFGVVTRLTRFTTWTGTVPHWLYFRWLYQRSALWNWTIVLIASCGVLVGLSGIVWGLAQLIPRRRPGGPPLTTYRTISRWHHLAGLGFGVVVVTWCVSGVWENLGSGNAPRNAQTVTVRGGATDWSAVLIPERDALGRLQGQSRAADTPIAIDLEQFDGRPGYQIRFADGRVWWVDARSGEPRETITESAIRQAAARVVRGSIPIRSVELVRSHDDYYYPGHEREAPLPAWRVSFGDREESRLYLDATSGRPLAFVDGGARRSRWMRDALHGLDFRFLTERRPFQELVMLTLLIGGVFSSGTGLLLAVRRMRRAWAARRIPSAPGMP